MENRHGLEWGLGDEEQDQLVRVEFGYDTLFNDGAKRPSGSSHDCGKSIVYEYFLPPTFLHRILHICLCSPIEITATTRSK